MGIDPRLTRLRVELFTAAQTLKGEDLKYFHELVRDVAAICDIAPLGGSGVAALGESPGFVADTRVERSVERTHGTMLVDIRKRLLERALDLLEKGADDGAAKLVSAYASVK